MKASPAQLYAFITLAEKLKTEYRHSWTSDNPRQESVADHSWMMCLVAMTVFDSIETKVDQLKVLKMIILHDLAEVIVGDIPSFEVSERRAAKLENERAAIRKLTSGLPKTLQEEFVALWEEMEAKDTAEAKLAQSIDKLEVLMQHMIAGLDTWDDNDFKLAPYYREELYDFDPFMRAFKDYITEQCWDDIDRHGSAHRLQPEYIERRRKK